MTENILHFFNIKGSEARYKYALASVYHRFKATHCFVGKFIHDEQVNTLLHLEHGKVVENFTYDLKATPCAGAKAIRDVYNCSDNVQAKFPDDTVLQTLSVDAYLAITICSFDNQPVGILVCLFEHPTSISVSDKRWFKEVSYLIGAEFQYENTKITQQKLNSQMAQGEKLADLCTLQFDPANGQLDCSENTYRIFEFSPDKEVSLSLLLGKVERRLLPKLNKKFTQLINGEISLFEFSLTIFISKAQKKHLKMRAAVSPNKFSGHQLVQMSVQDVSHSAQLIENVMLSKIVFEHSSEAVMITDADNNIVQVNRALEELTGYSEQELIGANPSIFSSGKQSPTFYKKMWDVLRTEGVWRGEIYNKRKNGEEFPEELAISLVKNEYDEVTHHVAVFRDITAWKKTEQQLRFFANKESLTGLNNRRAFVDLIDKHTENGRAQQSPLVIMFIGLNRFKEVNDVYGHALADDLLVAVSKRITHVLNDEGSACRYGGDEFTVLLPNCLLEKSVDIAQDIIDSLQQPYTLDHISLSIEVNIGLAQYPESGQTSTELLKNANYALRQAQLSHHIQISLHDEKLKNQYLRKLFLRDKLKVAIEEQKLSVYYQPIICATTKKIMKFEALIRWKDEELGFVSPAEFISIAEEFGLISSLGQFVLEQACGDLQQLHALGFSEIAVSINRSINEFKVNVDQVKLIKAAIYDAGLSPESIIIEITESVAMSSANYIKESLSQLKKAGIKIALDDFCTGFSSLSNLIDYPSDILKIDKTFVDKIQTEINHGILIQTLIDMANRLGMKVVAEGVEAQEQFMILQGYGCHYIQGYLFSPAIPFSECISLLQQHNDVAFNRA